MDKAAFFRAVFFGCVVVVAGLGVLAHALILPRNLGRSLAGKHLPARQLRGVLDRWNGREMLLFALLVEVPLLLLELALARLMALSAGCALVIASWLAERALAARGGESYERAASVARGLSVLGLIAICSVVQR